MPKKKYPQKCNCGCGEQTKGGDFCPGHDQKLRVAIERRAGGLLALKKIAEGAIGEQIFVERCCPECAHPLKGNTWAGIDAHWKSQHLDIMSYKDAWPMIRDDKYEKRNRRKKK